MIFIIIALIALVIILLLAFLKEKQQLNQVNTETTDTIETEEIKEYPYKKKLLLTKNEWYFYKKLKPICDKYNLHILSKIRFADLVEVESKIDNKEKIKYFNKISRKHIDFVLCKPENLQIIALIELDDKSHEQKNRIERDNFIDNVCKKTGYKIIHIRNYEEIEEKLLNAEIITKGEN